jgi:hypothetical protein
MMIATLFIGEKNWDSSQLNNRNRWLSETRVLTNVYVVLVMCEHMMYLIRNVSCQYIFMSLDVRILTCQLKKSEHTCLKNIKLLAHHVKRVRIYMYLIYVNTYNTYKFNKI